MYDMLNKVFERQECFRYYCEGAEYLQIANLVPLVHALTSKRCTPATVELKIPQTYS